MADTTAMTFGPDDPAALACLRAARGLGLVLRYTQGASKLSSRPNEGWWGRKSYGASPELGGPWSVEFITRMCHLGLVSLCPMTAASATVTKAGRQLLRAKPTLPPQGDR